MEENCKKKITVRTSIDAPIESVWEFWTTPNHIVNWNAASEDWHTTKAINNLHVNGRFCYHMAAKDESFAFDLEGTYTQIIPLQLICFRLDDDRMVEIKFISTADSTEIIEIFEAENVYPPEQQQTGWQSILDNFKKYVNKNWAK